MSARLSDLNSLQAESILSTKTEYLPRESQLSSLTASLFTCILENCVDSLNILGKSWKKLPEATIDLTYRTIDEKLSNIDCSKVIFNKQTIKPYAEEFIRENFYKFQQDRLYAELVLHETVIWLAKYNNFRPITIHIGNHEQSVKDEEALLAENEINSSELAKLTNKFIQERKSFSKILKYAQVRIGFYKNELQKIIYDNRITGNYVREWEDTRHEQNNIIINSQENHYINKTTQTIEKIDQENRINAELTMFIMELHNDHLNSIEYWMETYETELEERELTISRLKEAREDQTKVYENLVIEYNDHLAEVEEWRIIIEDRRRAAELLKIQTACAIKIQAWWRGTMVRKHLGPFRKKKGKGKGKGKGKKGKGGKKGKK